MPFKPKMPESRIADSISASWVNTSAPHWARPFLQLSRADRPIGTWLLLLPCWWSLFLVSAARGQNIELFDLWIFIACAFGAWLMRGAGCTWNDITDRHYDAKVARTSARPIPSGRVNVRQAALWMGLQGLIAFALLLSFPKLAIGLGVLSLLLVVIYPFAKRVTWWPQVFLGLAFNWGVLLVWAAKAESLALPAISLYFSGIAWTLFYDTIYAHQDSEDDALIGIKSTARLFGKNSPNMLLFFALLSAGLMGLSVFLALGERGNMALLLGLLGVLGFFSHLIWQLKTLDISDPETCLRLFRTNRDAGLIVVVFFALIGVMA